MIERIQELARRTGFELNPVHFDHVKFTELIVQECINVVKKRYMGDNNREDMEVKRCIEDLNNYWS